MAYIINNCEIALNVHNDIWPRILFANPIDKLTKKKREKWHEEFQYVLDQIKPNLHIQYVYVNDPLVAEYLLDLEVIKPTKRVGKERYVVDKTKLFASWEPSQKWFSSLSDEGWSELIDAYENGEVVLVVPNEV